MGTAESQVSLWEMGVCARLPAARSGLLFTEDSNLIYPNKQKILMKFSLDSYKAIIYYKVFPKQNAALVKKTEEQSSYQ